MEIKSIATIVGLALVLATTSTQLVFAHGTQTHINIHNNIHCPNNLNVGISGNTCTAVGSTGSTNIYILAAESQININEQETIL